MIRIAVILASLLTVLAGACAPQFQVPTVMPDIGQPDSPMTAYQYLEQGTQSLENNQLAQAVRYFSRVIDVDPGNAEAFRGRGKAYIYSHEWDKALQDCTKIIDLKPGYSEAYYLRGLAYIGKKDYRKAVADFGRFTGTEMEGKQQADLQRLTDIVVPPGELVLLNVEYSSTQTGICNEAICYAPIGYNITLRLTVFANPVKPGISIDSLKIEPKIDGVSQLPFRRVLSGPGMEILADNVPALEAYSLQNCSVNYKTGNVAQNKQSNRVSPGVR